MKRTRIYLFSILLVFTFVSVQNPLTNDYVHSLKRESLSASIDAKPDSSLMDKIKRFAETHHVKPINARIDPVWKAIPGYNGLTVDIKASYERMKKKGTFEVSKIVYKQTSPEVSLSDLPPAPIYRGNPEKPMVTFLINVAWGTEFLPDMLETLKKYKLHTTFFLDGSWVKKNRDMAKIILEEGHEIGNHAYSHPDLQKSTNSRIKEELKKTNEIIESTLDVIPKWFAPPSGSYRGDVINIASAMKMNTILWSVDTVDWKKPNPSDMANRVVNKIHPGALVLMHPTSSTSQGLEQMITGIQSKGYSIGTVSQVISEKRIVRNNEKSDFDKELSK